MTTTYQLGLLYLVHLLIGADGEISRDEHQALDKIIQKEKIPHEVYERFEQETQTVRERDIYHKGIQLISQCSAEERLNAFVTLLKLSEVDGRVHVKEIKFLLYSIEHAGVEFDEVVRQANLSPEPFFES